jgi:hypothetical protein
LPVTSPFEKMVRNRSGMGTRLIGMPASSMRACSPTNRFSASTSPVWSRRQAAAPTPTGSTSTSLFQASPTLASMARDKGRLPQVSAPTPIFLPLRSFSSRTGRVLQRHELEGLAAQPVHHEGHGQGLALGERDHREIGICVAELHLPVSDLGRSTAEPDTETYSSGPMPSSLKKPSSSPKA